MTSWLETPRRVKNGLPTVVPTMVSVGSSVQLGENGVGQPMRMDMAHGQPAARMPTVCLEVGTLLVGREVVINVVAVVSVYAIVVII